MKKLDCYSTKKEVQRQLNDGVDNPVDVMEAFEEVMSILEDAVLERDWNVIDKIIIHWNQE